MSSTTRGAATFVAKAGIATSLAIVGLSTPAHANPANDTPAQTKPAVDLPATVIPDRVMSWNSNGQKLSTPEDIVDHIKRFRPQLVLLQESCRTEVRKAVKFLNQIGFEYEFKLGPGIVNLGCDGWSENGQAIVYAKGTPIQNYLERRYRVDEGPWESRAYTAFTTRLAGRQVRVFNTQLSWGPYHEERGKQVEELASATLRYRTALVAGDLNAQPSDKEMRPLWRAGFSDVDPFCRQRADRRCNWTHVGVHKKFDYILHRGVNSLNCILRTVNEDHRVVITDVTRAQGPRAACSAT
ncbi:endonuclease/exonuclease/phosphatase family protein [Streptomyces coffeae]|uniref:Endonuclease/exonuclease/phosphatase family protein n=1 Tax=Streptomyces coffeae TaxID=621382 RepID=A0ABS1NNB9_9ACTN|nr:endonuclease/exonuclease/phosphatase family protein [Streptomyces coffeae]MBL1101600.1 endonuclease/exonuclease/phosphatase family protein [Streptomyces coffeae]